MKRVILMLPILTIIIPHYNVPSYLRRLLTTIPNMNDIETIVVDDRSTEHFDEYEALKSNYPHVTFVRNDSIGKGAGAARNVGLKLAKGKWLLFADSDDTFAPDLYETVSAWFDSDVDIVFFPPLSFYYDSKKEHDIVSLYLKYIDDYEKTKSKKAEQVLRYMWHVPWSRLIRKETIDIHGVVFSETLRANDILFAVVASHYAKQIAVSNKNIYIHEVRSGSTGTSLTATKILDRANEVIKKYCFLRENLPKNEFIALPLHGVLIILRSILDGRSPKLTFRTAKMCCEHRVKLFHRGFFNPTYISRIVLRYLRYKRHVKNIETFES